MAWRDLVEGILSGFVEASALRKHELSFALGEVAVHRVGIVVDKPLVCERCGSPLPYQHTGRPRRICPAEECQRAHVAAYERARCRKIIMARPVLTRVPKGAEIIVVAMAADVHSDTVRRYLNRHPVRRVSENAISAALVKLGYVEPPPAKKPRTDPRQLSLVPEGK